MSAGVQVWGEWCVAVSFIRSGAKRSLRLPHVVPPPRKKTKAGREPCSFVSGTYRSSKRANAGVCDGFHG